MSPTNAFAEPYAQQTDTADEPVRLERLEFHIKTGDYFPLLATVMGFLEESIRTCENGFLTIAPIEAKVIENIRQDLIHLHKHYQIQPKHDA
ncbi:MAG: hypothetical protein JWO84_555 [Parcubacteria group bacterium]|nr:hypothetical protein [Parcubacteria group bacterium]